MVKGKQDDWLILNDTATTSAIIGALKRSFSRSPIVRSFLDKYRIERDYIKKDGTKSKVPRVFYKCFHCHKEFPSTQIQVDHVDPVVPINIPTRHASLDVIVNRLYCGEKGLQILCKQHHKEKSIIENDTRNEWLLKVKYIVYETTNKISRKKYIGVHKCVDYDDFYLGSGTYIKQAVKKHGNENFYRTIIEVYDNSEDAFKKEEELVNDEIVESDNYYNLVTGGKRGGTAKDTGKIPVICHQTQEEFPSIMDLSKLIGVHHTTICHSIDNPNKPINNLHYFKKSSYDRNIQVSFPKVGKSVICLNNGKVYKSIREAADLLKLSYRSLRNSMMSLDEEGYRCLLDYKFLYLDEYDKSKRYQYSKEVIRCIDLNLTFDTSIEAAKFLSLKKKTESMVALGINKAIRLKHKAYKYQWERITITSFFDN